MPGRKFDRSAEDMGNIVGLEHVNVCVPDQRLANIFYIMGLGLTRDPYLTVGVGNMWVNIGRNQMHLPTAEAQVLRGRIGLTMPSLSALLKRLEAVKTLLDGTRFKVAKPKANDSVDVTCPWGNRFRVHQAGPAMAPIQLGMPYVEFDVRKGAARGIGRFYRDVFGAPVSVEKVNGAPAARVKSGFRQEMIFRETDGPEAPYDKHHVQIYLADFSSPHRRLTDLGVISRDDSPHQYRFVDIVDLDSGKLLFQVEHEVRAMTHPLYARALVNRNPDQGMGGFTPGYQELPWAAAPGM